MPDCKPHFTHSEAMEFLLQRYLNWFNMIWMILFLYTLTKDIVFLNTVLIL